MVAVILQMAESLGKLKSKSWITEIDECFCFLGVDFNSQRTVVHHDEVVAERFPVAWSTLPYVNGTLDISIADGG